MRGVVLAILLAGCGPAHPGASSDGGVPDSGLAFQTCAPSFGRVYIIDTFGLLPSDQGFDLDGDGTVDNSLGGVAPFANPTFQRDIVGGSAIFLIAIAGLPDPLADTTSSRFSFWIALDADMPPDPTNNISGAGQFLVPAQQLDVDCAPTTVFEHDALQGGVYSVSTSHLRLVAQAIGELESFHDQLQFTISPDEAHLLSGKLGSASAMCALAKISSPITPMGTLLDNIVGQFGLQPDIDANGDGLEQLKADSSTGFVSQCVTADGSVIDGHACPCDPRMHDAYSMTFFFTGVPAQIVGLAAGSGELP